MGTKSCMPVALDLTNACNNRCLYCSARAEDGSRSAQQISYEDACRLLRIVAQEFRINDVRFTGGEATLHPRLADLVRFAREEIRSPLATLLTNGRRLRDPAYCSCLHTAGLNRIQISLESCRPQIHDQMVATSGAWKQTVEGIRVALTEYRGMERGISIKTTLTELNLPTLVETIHFIADLGIRVLSMNICSTAGRGARQLALIPPPGSRIEILSRARDIAERVGLTFEAHFSFDLCVENPTANALRHYACGRGRGYIALDHGGNILVCHACGKSGGNLLAVGSVRSLWNADILKYQWHNRHLPDRCRACEQLSACGGVCPNYLTTGYAHIYTEGQAVKGG